MSPETCPSVDRNQLMRGAMCGLLVVLDRRLRAGSMANALEGIAS